MKQQIQVIVFLVVFSALGGMVAQAQPITISTFGEGNNPMIKICKQVMTEAYRRIGRTMNVKYFSPERAIVTSNAGNVDGELGRTIEAEKPFPNLRRVPFPIAVVDSVVFTKEKTFPVKGWNSLLPYRVGYMRGIRIIENNLAEGTKAEPVGTLGQVFKKLDAGRSDVAIEARLPGLITIKKLGLTGISILEPPLLQIDMFHYLHVKNQHLVEPLTEALQQMEKEGIIQEIQQQVEQAILSPSK